LINLGFLLNSYFKFKQGDLKYGGEENLKACVGHFQAQQGRQAQPGRSDRSENPLVTPPATPPSPFQFPPHRCGSAFHRAPRDLACTRRWRGGSAALEGAGFHLPTGPAKPPGFGTGIPVRFGRKPVSTGRIQI